MACASRRTSSYRLYQSALPAPENMGTFRYTQGESAARPHVVRPGTARTRARPAFERSPRGRVLGAAPVSTRLSQRPFGEECDRTEDRSRRETTRSSRAPPQYRQASAPNGKDQARSRRSTQSSPKRLDARLYRRLITPTQRPGPNFGNVIPKGAFGITLFLPFLRQMADSRAFEPAVFLIIELPSGVADSP
jgi:hypothetical protein